MITQAPLVTRTATRPESEANAKQASPECRGADGLATDRRQGYVFQGAAFVGVGRFVEVDDVARGGGQR
jgi:hypothetical protein